MLIMDSVRKLDILKTLYLANVQDVDDLVDVMDILSEDSTSSSSDDSNSSSSLDNSTNSEETVFKDYTNYTKCIFVTTMESYSDADFKQRMRLKRDTVEYLISRFALHEYVDVPSGGRPKISSRTKIYMYVWYICNTITFRQLGSLFGVMKSSAWKCVRSVAHWLISISHEYIKWPQGAALERIRQKFYQKTEIPGVIGVLGCTRLCIRAPKFDKEHYRDTNKNYSLALQGVVDVDHKFVDIFCGEPGSLDNNSVLEKSELFSASEHSFPDGAFILADPSYDPLSWLVPPFKDEDNLSVAQSGFNYIHTTTCMVVEDAFELLKGRFQKLQKLTEQTDLCAITNLIASACVLHNICLTKDDSFENESVQEAKETTATKTFNEYLLEEASTDCSQIEDSFETST